MSTGPLFDHRWLLALGVVAVPPGFAYATVAVVRARASARRLDVDVGRGRLFTVLLGLFVLVASCGGAILYAVRGIPPGLGLGGVLGFLLAVYGGPLAVGAYLLGRFVSSHASGSETDGVPGRLVVETGAVFACFHVAVFPALWLVVIVA